MPVTAPYIHTYDRVDPRLGRIVVHDPRSRNYTLPRRSRPTTRISWVRNGKVFDQGTLGMCTATAGLGLRMTAPFSNVNGQQYDEFDCQQLYREETRIDDSEIPGHWEPTDTGSSGLWLMKAMQARGLIGEYLHAFDLDTALGALVAGPIAVGSIWLRGMFTPDRSGVIPVNTRDRIVGGHEYVIDGYDPATGLVDMTNSWGTTWGLSGRAKIRAADLGWLLSQQGDVVQPTVVAPPPPPPPPPPPAPGADTALITAFDAFAGAFTTWRASRP